MALPFRAWFFRGAGHGSCFTSRLLPAYHCHPHRGSSGGSPPDPDIEAFGPGSVARPPQQLHIGRTAWCSRGALWGALRQMVTPAQDRPLTAARGVAILFEGRWELLPFRANRRRSSRVAEPRASPQAADQPENRRGSQFPVAAAAIALDRHCETCSTEGAPPKWGALTGDARGVYSADREALPPKTLTSRRPASRRAAVSGSGSAALVTAATTA